MGNVLARKPYKFAPCSSRWGVWPVSIAARDADPEGEAQKAWVNRTPSRAARSRLGVRTALSPYAPACGQDQLSARQSKMLGGWAARAAPSAAPAGETRQSKASAKPSAEQRWLKEGNFRMSVDL